MSSPTLKLLEIVLNPLWLILIGALAVRYSSTEIKEVVRRQKAEKVFAHRAGRSFVEPLPPSLAPVESLDDPSSIEGDRLDESIKRIMKIAESERPDFLFGIHTSGRLLSVAVAKELNIPASRVGYIGSRTGTTGDMTIIWPDEQLSGKALVLDDISRTGATLAAAQAALAAHLLYEGRKLKSAEFAVLARATFEDELERTIPVVESYRVNSREYYFPWTPYLRRIRNAYDEAQAGAEPDRELLSDYHRILNDFEYANAVINRYRNRGLIKRYWP